MNHVKIYCFGDSHVGFFGGVNKIQPVWPKKADEYLPFFKIYPLGPVLAFNLVKNGTKTKGREKLFKILKQILKGSDILMSFGEIDCRAHLLKQSELQKRPIKKVVSECVDRYFSVILDLKKKGYKMWVWNVPPSTRFEKVEDKNFPVYGTNKQRNEITKLFNTLLEKKCRKYGIKFVSVYKKIIDKNGLTDMSYYFDMAHLSQKIMPQVLKIIEKEINTKLELTIGDAIRRDMANLKETVVLKSTSIWHKGKTLLK